MATTTRVICDKCLLSVQRDVEGSADNPLTCPFCRGTIDGPSSTQEWMTRITNVKLLRDPDPEAESSWIQRWQKGTFGTIGRFQLRELLGDRRFGRVFLAYDPRLDRDVVLKVFKLANPDDQVVQRFFREARAAARLDHPNIVKVYDAGHDDGCCWIVYQYVAGRALSLPHGRRMDVAAVVRIVRDLADALDHMHRQKVFHRDLKPANIIVDDRGRPHLTDFGLARRAVLDSDLSRDGAIIGTPANMSPEQTSGRSTLVNERRDVYNLGVIFFELLCGRRPVNLPSEATVWLSKASNPTPSLSPRTIDRTIPAALDRICLETLNVNPEGRYPSARALAADLDRWLDRRKRATALSTPLVCIASGVIAAALVLSCRWLTPSLTPQIPHAPAIAAAADRQVIARPATTTPAGPSQTSIEIPSVGAVTAGSLVGNRRTMTYHRTTCPLIDATQHGGLIYFAQVKHALDRRYVPCIICYPPVSDEEQPVLRP